MRAVSSARMVASVCAHVYSRRKKETGKGQCRWVVEDLYNREKGLESIKRRDRRQVRAWFGVSQKNKASIGVVVHVNNVCEIFLCRGPVSILSKRNGL